MVWHAMINAVLPNTCIMQLCSFNSSVKSPDAFVNNKYRIRRCVVRASMHADSVTQKDMEYMKLAIQLARRALGHTSPNPMVGCVIVKDGNIVGQGFHPKAGEPHAEVFALREASTNANGSTAYVSLEPCNHFGRTPPCTAALIQAKVKRVVVGMSDPNPIVAGTGINTLRKAGVEVVVGVEMPSCIVLNEAYIHRMLQKKPFVTLRFSSSLDGGYLENDSISCTEGTYFSRLLQENDAVIVSGSALLEDPTLVTAEAGAKQPLRIVLTSTLQLPPDASIFDTSVAPTLVIASEEAVVSDSASSNKGKSGQTMESKLQERGVEVVGVQELDFDSVLEICYARGFCSVLVDGRSDGRSSIAKQALEEKVVQKLVVDVAPKLCGHSKVGPGFTVDKDLEYLERVSSKMCGDHVIIEGYFRNKDT